MIISVLNLKGGVGKTTSVVNLAAAFAELGQSTLQIDLDGPQYTLGNYNKNATALTRYVSATFGTLGKILQSEHGMDHVLIDCPPRVGGDLDNQSGLTALYHSDIALVPVEAHGDALVGAYSTRDVIEESVRHRNARIEMWLLLTMYRSAWKGCRTIRDQARNDFEGRVFKTIVAAREEFVDAGIARKSVLKSAPKSRGADEYRKVAAELLKRR